MSDLSIRLPADPLKQAIARRKQLLDLTWEELGSRLGVTERTLQRLMSYQWIGVYAADHMAIRLGLHPCNLWPREWAAAATGRGTNRTRKGADMTSKTTNRVIVIVEGGIADWVMKPDGVEVDVYDFDQLRWLSRDDRYELMSQLESGDDELPTLAFHLTQEHYWEDLETEISALPVLHAQLHEQTDCCHDHEEARDDS